jgi:hypothetical protein
MQRLVLGVPLVFASVLFGAQGCGGKAIVYVEGDGGGSSSTTPEPVDANMSRIMEVDSGTTILGGGGDCSDGTYECPGHSLAYTCTGGVSPSDADDGIICDKGRSSSDGTVFCCLGLNDPGCQETSACPAAEIGLACSSSSTNPIDSGSNLACSGPAVDNGVSSYCCVPFADKGGCVPLAGQCDADNPAAIGFRCEVGDPTAGDPYLDCSAGTPDVNGGMAYCCTSN